MYYFNSLPLFFIITFMMKYILFAFTVIFILSCNIERTTAIPDEILPYVESFFEEAQIRGLDIEMSDYVIHIDLKDIDNPDHAGTCNSRANRIEIDENTWSNFSHEKREWLIFHELGHCILNRSHKNKRTSDFECLSYMRGGKDDDFDCSTNLYSDLWRSYYLNELFNDTEELPDWHKQNQDILDNLPIQYVLIDTSVTSYIYREQLNLQEEQNFLIEMTFSNWEEQAAATVLSWDVFTFIYCKNCTEGNLTISKDNKRIYQGISSEPTQSSLAIMKYENLYSFVFCDEVIHTIEFSKWQNPVLQSNTFDEAINMSVELSLLD